MGVIQLQDGSTRELTLEDLQLYVKLSPGDVVEKDCSCNSAFMLQTMPDVGRELRNKFHWILDAKKIYLVMDNAGGHGSMEAINEYSRLLNDYNVEIVWQIPRSPETNMLDLGVWMSIQRAVEKQHYGRRYHHDALAASVEEAWSTKLNKLAFKNVYEQL